MRQRELAATAKAFMLDRPEVSLQELTEHLRSMAEQFLTDAIFGMTPSAYSSWFNSRVLTEALGDATDVSLHSLRHWLATRMKERGANLVDAQGILGHSSQSITYDLYGKGHAVGRLAEVLKTALL